MGGSSNLEIKKEVNSLEITIEDMSIHKPHRPNPQPSFNLTTLNMQKVYEKANQDN